MVRDNEVAARLSGIDVARTQVLAYVISAVCAGLAGSLFAYWVTVTSPSGFTLTLSLSLLTAVVIGGLGSLIGAVLGSFILVYLPLWTGGFCQQPEPLQQCGQQCADGHLRDRAHRCDPRLPARHRRRRFASLLHLATRVVRSNRRAGALPAAPDDAGPIAPSQ